MRLRLGSLNASASSSSLARSAPIVLPPAEALGPVFGREGEVYFRGPEGNLWVPLRLHDQFRADPEVHWRASSELPDDFARRPVDPLVDPGG
jgi:hypothetical protein